MYLLRVISRLSEWQSARLFLGQTRLIHNFSRNYVFPSCCRLITWLKSAHSYSTEKYNAFFCLMIIIVKRVSPLISRTHFDIINLQIHQWNCLSSAHLPRIFQWQLRPNQRPNRGINEWKISNAIYCRSSRIYVWMKIHEFRLKWDDARMLKLILIEFDVTI